MAASILIVEDESIVALDLQKRLHRFGYHIAGVTDTGDTALRLAAATRPDLVLMDIRLKGSMDGIATAEQLRTQFEIPVIYLTAYADETTLQRAKYTEPSGYLVKPFDERELHSTVEMAHYKLTNERRLKARSTRLQKLLATVPDGVVLLDGEHRVTMVNDRARSFLSLLAGAGDGEILERIGEWTIGQLMLASQQHTWHEIRLPGELVFEVRIAPLSFTTNSETTASMTEWLLVIRDITAEHQMQQRIQTQDRLAAIGQFATGIARDFNNILASIMVQLPMIEKAEPLLSPKVKDHLATILQQATRASAIVDQILDFSGQSRAAKQPVNLVAVLKEGARLLAQLLPQNVTVELDLAPGEFILEADATRMMQVLMNLTFNARDAMPGGGVIRLEVRRTADADRLLLKQTTANEWLRLRVSDTGVGIDPAHLPHIFEPFFTTKAVAPGTGLGLAQVIGIIQDHGGSVQVQSQPGKGTTFTLYLPLTHRALPLEVAPPYLATAPAAPKQRCILFVDDNRILRQSIAEFLELSNFKVLQAANGHEALEQLLQPEAQPDLIMTDLDMPYMGGLDLCRELNRLGNTAPVIVMSGYLSSQVRAELQALGITYYLDKPVRVEDLLEVIETATNEAASR